MVILKGGHFRDLVQSKGGGLVNEKKIKEHIVSFILLLEYKLHLDSST